MVVSPSYKHYWFFSPLLNLLWQQEPDLPYTQVLLSGLSVQLLLFVLCRDLRSLCSPKERTQPFPTRAVFTPNLCNTFCLRCEMLVASHTHSGTKQMGSQQKAEEAKQGFREERKGLGEEKVWGQRQKAAPCHPSCCGASSSFPRGLLRGPCAHTAVQLVQTIHRPVNLAASSTVSGPGELTAAVHSALLFPILVVALRWQTGTGKRILV